MDLVKIAVRISKNILSWSATRFSGLRGWLYVDSGKFIELPEKYTHHYEFGRDHIMKDAGYEEFKEKMKNEKNLDLLDSNTILLALTEDPDSQLAELVYDNTSLTKDMVKEMIGDKPEVYYSRLYNAISIWLHDSNTLMAGFHDWNTPALETLQQFLKKEGAAATQVAFKNWTNGKEVIRPTDRILKYKSASEIFKEEEKRSWLNNLWPEPNY